MPDFSLFPGYIQDLPLFPDSMPEQFLKSVSDPDPFPNSESSSEYRDVSESFYFYATHATDEPETYVDGESHNNDTYNNSE